MEDDSGMSPTLGYLFKERLSDSLSAEKNTEVVRLINLRMGEFVSMFIECLSTWNLWKQFQDCSIIIASACVISLGFVMSRMPFGKLVSHQ